MLDRDANFLAHVSTVMNLADSSKTEHLLTCWAAVGFPRRRLPHGVRHQKSLNGYQYVLSIYLSIYLSVCASVHPSICLSNSFYLNLYLSVYMDLFIFVDLSYCLSILDLPVFLDLSHYLCMLICLPIWQATSIMLAACPSLKFFPTHLPFFRSSLYFFISILPVSLFIPVFCLQMHYFFAFLVFFPPPLWSSGQSSWLQTQGSRVRSRRYKIFWVAMNLERGPLPEPICEPLMSFKRTCSMRNAGFWYVAPCGSCKNQRFEATYHLHRQGEKSAN
jgi:hypothetical protein